MEGNAIMKKLKATLVAAAALVAATGASAADQRNWERTLQRIDRAERAIRSLDTAARAATRSRDYKVRIGGYSYLGGRRVGSLIVGGRDRSRH